MVSKEILYMYYILKGNQIQLLDFLMVNVFILPISSNEWKQIFNQIHHHKWYFTCMNVYYITMVETHYDLMLSRFLVTLANMTIPKFNLKRAHHKPYAFQHHPRDIPPNVL